ncbi:MAG: decarboxylase [archaeon]
MIPNPKFIISKSKVLEEYNNLLKYTDIISYSVKSNPYITEILEDNSSSQFLVHSINELDRVRDGSKIWYMIHACDTQELEILFAKKVNSFIVDNLVDLNNLLEYIKENKQKINLLLRMKLKENTIHTGRYFVFGLNSDIINKQILILRENKLIEKLGIHFHRKTLNLDEWSIISELEDSILPETFKLIDLLDIGGGVPIIYKNTNISSIISVYNRILELKEYVNSKNIKLIIEPGRAIAGPCAILETTIKNVIDDSIIIDASVYNCSLDTIVANVKLLVEDEVEKEDSSANTKAYTIKGCTPCSLDIFRYRVYFDKSRKLAIGDKIRFINAGAYIYSSDFADLTKPKIEIRE